MPEGPECRIIAEGLRKELVSSLITGAELLGGRYVKHGPPDGFIAWHDELPIRCTNVKVKGKFIYLTFHSTGLPWSIWYMFNTLGMSGIWLKHRTDYARMKLSYRKDGATQDSELFFSDIRNYGTLKLVKDIRVLGKKLDNLGLDHLNDVITPAMTFDVLSKKRNVDRTMAEVLMDQSNFAGVGNYCKAEVLWRCGLSPHRTPRSLTQKDIVALHNGIFEVLRDAYEHNGMVLSDYASLYGKGAGFDDERSGVFERKVYGRSKDALGNDVIQEETKDGRTTHWAPAAQK